MQEKQPIKAAILERLQRIGISANQPVSLYELAPLVYSGYDQHDIVNALFTLQDQKVIELMAGNRLQLLLPVENLSRFGTESISMT